jgi:hypothetical protein
VFIENLYFLRTFARNVFLCSICVSHLFSRIPIEPIMWVFFLLKILSQRKYAKRSFIQELTHGNYSIIDFPVVDLILIESFLSLLTFPSF